MGDLRNVLGSPDWRGQRQALVTAAAAAEVTEFDEMAAGLNAHSLRHIRTRGDAVVMAKVLNHGGEGQQWVENLADAILSRVAILRLEQKQGARHDPPEQGDRPPEADHS